MFPSTPSKKRGRSVSRQTPRTPKRVRVVPQVQPYPMRRVERKRKYYGLAPITPSTAVVNLYNPLYYLVPGGSRDQRLGNRISNAWLHYSLHVNPMLLNALGDWIDQGCTWRIVVFTHTKEWTSGVEGAWALNTLGAGTAITTAEILKDTGSDRAAQSFLNVDEIVVLHDRQITLERTEFGTLDQSDLNGPHRIVSGKCRLGDFRFNDGTNAYGRDRNVYVALMSSSASGNTIEDVGRAAINMLITFDDA